MSSGQVDSFHTTPGCSLLFFSERKPKVVGGHAGRAGLVVTVGKHTRAQRVWLLLVQVKGQAKQRVWGGGALTR